MAAVPERKAPPSFFLRLAYARERIRNYSEDQERDDHGRWSSGGGGDGGSGIGRVAGKDLIGSGAAALAERVTDDARLAQVPAASRDRVLSAIAHEQGFDGPPRVVDKAEMDRLIAAGSQELLRGVEANGDKTAAQINEEMRTGEAAYGRGTYGNGYHFGTSLLSGLGANPENFSDGTKNSIARATLRGDAHVVDAPALFESHRTFMESVMRGDYGASAWRSMERAYSDPGRFAAALGFDAIRANYGDEPQVIVLNRTALIVQEAEQ